MKILILYKNLPHVKLNFFLLKHSADFDEVQSNHVNYKSLGLKGLFTIISSSNYREVGRKIYNPENDYHFPHIKDKLWMRKRNISWRRFFYTDKTYVIIDSY